jgi:hypothetical protein
MIVIDVGCAKHGSDESIPYLIEEFQPDILYGFDPAAEAATNYGGKGDVSVVVRPEVAWICDGEIGFKVAGLGGRVDPGARTTFPCFDLARFINERYSEEIVLKMDAEGSEYDLLPHLIATGADERLKLLWIEWHCEVCGLGGNGRHRDFCNGDHAAWDERRERLTSQLRCEVAEWNR